MTTERMRREALEKRRTEMGKGMRFYREQSRDGEATEARLVNAEGMLWAALSAKYEHHHNPLMAEVAADFGVNDELTRVILLGKREPSKAFLDAVGYERVALYRRKADTPS